MGVPLLISLSIVQSSVLPRISGQVAVPNLLLLTVICWGFQRGANEGIVWALIGGLALDLASGSPVGVSPPSLMVAALVAGAGRDRFFRGNVVLLALITLLSLVLFQVTYLVLLALAGHPVGWLTQVWQVGSRLVLLHLALMPVVYLGVAGLAQVGGSTRLRFG